MRPSAAKPGARTNPSPHTAARGEQPLRPRPKNARRHWPAAGGSGAVIGATPRAGSISRGALREVVETQFKSRSGGSPGVWPVCFPFSTLPLRTAIRVRSYCFSCAVSSPPSLLEKQLFSPGSLARARAEFHSSCEDPGLGLSPSRDTDSPKKSRSLSSPKRKPCSERKEARRACRHLTLLDLIYLGEGESGQLDARLCLANASFVPETREKPDLDYWAL